MWVLIWGREQKLNALSAGFEYVLRHPLLQQFVQCHICVQSCHWRAVVGCMRAAPFQLIHYLLE